MTPFNSFFLTKPVTNKTGPVGRQKALFFWVKTLAGKGFSLLVGLATVGLSGCEGNGLMPADWERYDNPRYNFAFPYPDTWVASPVVDNRDGRMFSDPNFEAVQITGWATRESLPSDGDGTPSEELPLSPNFVTEQGIPGRLEVEIGMDMSLMTLRLSQDGVLYYWQGRSPSDLFDDYYPFFYYVAQHYRIEPSGEN